MHTKRSHHKRYKYLSPTSIYPPPFSPTDSSAPSSNALTFNHYISSLPPSSFSTLTTSYGNSYSSYSSLISSSATQASTSYSTSQSTSNTIIATKNDNPYLMRVLLLGSNHDILAINVYNYIRKTEYYQEYTQKSIPNFNISDIANIMINCIANNMKIKEQQNPALQLLIMENMNGRCYVTLGDGPMMPTFAVKSVTKIKKSLSTSSLLSSSTIIIHEDENMQEEKEMLVEDIPLPETKERKMKYEEYESRNESGNESETYEEMEDYSIIDEEYFQKRKSFQNPIQRQQKCINILALVQAKSIEQSITDVSAYESGNDTYSSVIPSNKFAFNSNSDSKSTLNRTETEKESAEIEIKDEIKNEDEKKPEMNQKRRVSNSNSTILPVSDVSSIFELDVSAMVDRFQRFNNSENIYCSPKSHHNRKISEPVSYGQILPLSTNKLKLFNSASDPSMSSTLPMLPPKCNHAFSNSEYFQVRKIEKRRNMRKLRKRESKSVLVTSKTIQLLASKTSSISPNITPEDYENIYFYPQIVKEVESNVDAVKVREKEKPMVKLSKMELEEKKNKKKNTSTKLKKYANINYNDVRKKTGKLSTKVKYRKNAEQMSNSLYIEQEQQRKNNKNINVNK